MRKNSVYYFFGNASAVSLIEPCKRRLHIKAGCVGRKRIQRIDRLIKAFSCLAERRKLSCICKNCGVFDIFSAGIYFFKRGCNFFFAETRFRAYTYDIVKSARRKKLFVLCKIRRIAFIYYNYYIFCIFIFLKSAAELGFFLGKLS